jgi:hypothetical protein
MTDDCRKEGKSMANTDVWSAGQTNMTRHRQEEPEQMELQINRSAAASMNEYIGMFDRPDTASLNRKKSVFEQTAVFHIRKEE